MGFVPPIGLGPALEEMRENIRRPRKVPNPYDGTRIERPPSPRVLLRQHTVSVVVGVIVVAVATASAFVLTMPLQVTVSDGSTAGVIGADFVNHTSPLWWFFNATSYANRSGALASTLTLRLLVSAYWDPVHVYIRVDIHATVEATFASELRPSEVTIATNETGRLAWLVGWPEPSPSYYSGFIQPGPDNVSYQPQSSLGPIVGPGSARLSSSLANATGMGPYYEFVYPLTVVEEDPLGDNTLLGLRATVSGGFAPNVSVGILLRVADLSA